MIKSMTGFGRGSCVQHDFGITVEMRSVNHRYADFNLRLPRELYQWEDKIRTFLKQIIERGRVEVTVILEGSPPGTRTVKIDYLLAEELNRELTILAQRLAFNLDANSLFAGFLPEIVQIEHADADEETVWNLLQVSLQQALDELVARRNREGASLFRDLEGRCHRLEELLEEISSRAPVIYGDYHLRLERKLREAFKLSEIDENRILMECALMVEKAGIDEETTRLRSHLQAFREALSAQGATGRRLDFIAQEMFRESNTIGAKSIDSQLTGLVVEVKTELEKIREQIQNIE